MWDVSARYLRFCDLAVHRSGDAGSRCCRLQMKRLAKDVIMNNSPTTQSTKGRDWEKETSKTRSCCRKRDTQPQSKGYMLTLTVTVTLSKEGIKEEQKGQGYSTTSRRATSRLRPNLLDTPRDLRSPATAPCRLCFQPSPSPSRPCFSALPCEIIGGKKKKKPIIHPQTPIRP